MREKAKLHLSATRIKSEGGGEDFRRRLKLSWEQGFVADISCVDGMMVTGVLVAMSITALILDRWDPWAGMPANDPFTLELADVDQVIVF